MTLYLEALFASHNISLLLPMVARALTTTLSIEQSNCRRVARAFAKIAGGAIIKIVEILDETFQGSKSSQSSGYYNQNCENCS